MATGLQKGSAGPTPCLVGQGSLLEAAALLTLIPPAGSWDHSSRDHEDSTVPGETLPSSPYLPGRQVPAL